MALVPAEVKGGRLPLHNAMPACITTQHAHTHTQRVRCPLDGSAPLYSWCGCQRPDGARGRQAVAEPSAHACANSFDGSMAGDCGR